MRQWQQQQQRFRNHHHHLSHRLRRFTWREGWSDTDSFKNQLGIKQCETKQAGEGRRPPQLTYGSTCVWLLIMVDKSVGVQEEIIKASGSSCWQVI